MKFNRFLLIGLALYIIYQPAIAANVDPLNSPSWDFMRQTYIGDEKWDFDERVLVIVPDYAEDPMQVPVQIDATALDNVEKIVAFADLNPIQHILDYEPGTHLKPTLSVRIKVQQATPVRAAVKTTDGKWHVGGAWLEAAGGGCTAPSVGTGNPYWEDHLGEIQSRAFSPGNLGSQRYKFRVIHPMDTGLASNIPEFYIERMLVKTLSGDLLGQLKLSQPVSENPVITLDMKQTGEPLVLWMRDNNGNEFQKQM